jgi:hypothetical protein
VVPVPERPYFFLPTLLFFQRDWPCDPIFSRWLRAAHTACQNGVCCHTNYWTKLPKFVHRKYESLVNIDVGTLLQIAQQKIAKTMKKIFKKKFISDLPTLIFSRYETGTTLHRYFFFTPNLSRMREECFQFHSTGGFLRFPSVEYHYDQQTRNSGENSSELTELSSTNQISLV